MQSPFHAEPIPTSDGSYTLKLKNHNEQYHSLNGALQESQHVFISSGLCAFDPLPDPLYVLENGLGTGLNALLTGREAIGRKTRILYEAIEPYPVAEEHLQKLNYPALFHEEWSSELFRRIHEAQGQKVENIRDRFFMRTYTQTLQEVTLEDNKYHLVYYDAFGPDTQPEMWTAELFVKVFESMKPGGILVTYCVKGDVRRAMKAAGFEVSKIPGPAGKREMSRAVKPL